jgi:hypothetical protein
MIYREKAIVNQRSYIPSSDFDRYLKDTLQLETKRRGKGDAAVDKRTSNRRSRRKNYYLNKYVFPSMANLIVFLEYASKQELRKLFDKDVKELLLSESASKSEKHPRPIFRRLVHAALAHTGKQKDDKDQEDVGNVLQEDYENIKPDDFKYLLAEMAEKEIMWMMLGATQSRFGSDTVAKSLIKPDMGRAETWLNLLASGVTPESKKFDPNNRPVLF